MNMDISTQGNLPKTDIKLISRVGLLMEGPHTYPHNNAKFYKPKKGSQIRGYFYRGTYQKQTASRLQNLRRNLRII